MMDGDGGLNTRNWGYYEPTASLRGGHLGLQLMSTLPDKPYLGGRMVTGSSNGLVHHLQSPLSIDYMREAWLNQREKYLNVLPGNSPNFGLLNETPSRAHPLQKMPNTPDFSKIESLAHVAEEAVSEKEAAPARKRQGSKTQKLPKPKKERKGLKVENGPPIKQTKAAKRCINVVVNGINMDMSSIPVPVCSCTGAPRQCYRWGCGGWQSACCTTGMSIYPLPMSTKRRGARIAGRKMSLGAFEKVLEKLAGEGYNLANPIDLKTHWARHGTNKFVIIK